MKILKVILLGVFLIVPVTGHTLVIYNFSDPVGDQTGNVDITNMSFSIDETNGDYAIDLTADSLNPFAGDFRININLFNVTRDEFFQDTFNDYLGLAPTTFLGLSGTNTNLMDWVVTDILATSTYDGFGNPDGISFFRSSAADLPFSPICVAEDVIGVNGCGDGAGVPEPTTIALIGIGLVGFGFVRRRIAAK